MEVELWDVKVQRDSLSSLQTGEVVISDASRVAYYKISDRA